MYKKNPSEKMISSFSSNKIGHRSPKNPSYHVKNTNHQHISSGKTSSNYTGRLGVNISIIIVLATPITPIPAVTLKHKTIHKK